MRPRRAVSQIVTSLMLLGAVAPEGRAQAPASLPAQADSTTARIHHERGILMLNDARYDSALVAFTDAIHLRERIADSVGLARSLNSIGSAYFQLGQFENALDVFLRSLSIRRALRDSIGIVRVQSNVGKVYQSWKQYDRALPAMVEAVDIAGRVDDPAVLGYALNSLGTLRTDLGEYTAARALFGRAIALYRTDGGRFTAVDSANGWAINTLQIGLVNLREGRPDLALPLIRRVLDQQVASKAVSSEARTRIALAQVYGASGRPRAALDEFTKALTLAEATDQRPMALEALQALAALEEEANHPAAALRYLHEWQALRDSIFDQAAQRRVAALEAREESERQQRETARLLEERRIQQALIWRQRILVVLVGLVLVLVAVLLRLQLRAVRRSREREAELQRANAELRGALAEVRTLHGLIPICANCKRVRDDRGFWEAVETYVSDRSKAIFSHAICHECGPKLYGAEWQPDVGTEEPHRH